MRWPLPAAACRCGGPAEDEIRAQVWGLLSAAYHQGRLPERRCHTALPVPLSHPPDPGGRRRPAEETVVVVGRDLSESGLGFYHHEPLPYRRVIASLEAPNGRWFAFLMDLTWCRFTKGGWYESGGRFIEAALSPLAE